MTHSGDSASLLTGLFSQALESVHGQYAVEHFLGQSDFEKPVALIALGKAASPMLTGALNALESKVHSAILITKEGHIDSQFPYQCIESSHPVPDQRSLDAGDALLSYIQSLPDDIEIIALVSGGTSALVEVLPDHVSLEDLKKVNEWLLSQGMGIHEMNRVRQAVSEVKGGKILQHLKKRKLTQLLISDVEGDDIEIIGSGLFVPSSKKVNLSELPGWIQPLVSNGEQVDINEANVSTHIIASNEKACHAVHKKATKMDYPAIYHGQALYGDINDIADMLFDKIKNLGKGIHIWGGETTVKLPSKPGRGGRNQALALALACRLQNYPGITVLVGATDGTDGPTEDAGAVVDCHTVGSAQRFSGRVEEMIKNADSGSFLAEAGALLSTGPTGTNVMDIVIAHID